MKGFTVNRKTFKVENPILPEKPPNFKKLQTLDMQNRVSFKSEYLMFIDIEPTDILGVVGTAYYVPFIKELSILVIKTTVFQTIENSNLWSNVKIHTFMDIKNHKKLIYKFIELYKFYNKPTIFAHNGCNFDFIIIKGYINRYMDENEISLINEMYFVDTFINTLKLKLEGVVSLSNLNLFKYYINDTDDILKYIHTAEADVKILCRWFQVFCHGV